MRTVEEMKSSSQAQRRKHLINAGMDRQEASKLTEIPWQVMLLGKKGLSAKEKAHALTITSSSKG